MGTSRAFDDGDCHGHHRAGTSGDVRAGKKPAAIRPQTSGDRQPRRRHRPGGIGYSRYWWNIGRSIESTNDAYAGGNITPVAPRVAGFVAQILMTDNQQVQAGQLLIRLDARDFRAALDHAQAIADQRQAALAGLQAKYVLQQEMIGKAEADLATKAAHATFAGPDAVRYRDLALTTFGTRQNA
jgi:membrane fusion protein (multidrug efflux system)